MSKAILIAVSLVFFLVSPHKVYAQVVVNEFLPAPSTGSNEWVEFYNSGTSTVDLLNYYFDDDADFNSDSGSSSKIAISGLLASQSVCYWDLSTYLNNNGDTPSLIGTDGVVVDSYVYTSTSPDKSYARVPDGGNWQPDQTPTKSSTSCLSLAPSPTPTPTPTPTPSPSPTEPPSPTPLKTATPSPTPKPSPTKSPTPSPTESPEPEITEIVLGAEKSPTPEPGPTGQTEMVGGWFTPEKILPFVFIIGGVGILAGVGFTFVRQAKLQYNGSHGNNNTELRGDTESGQ